MPRGRTSTCAWVHKHVACDISHYFGNVQRELVRFIEPYLLILVYFPFAISPEPDDVEFRIFPGRAKGSRPTHLIQRSR